MGWLRIVNLVGHELCARSVAGGTVCAFTVCAECGAAAANATYYGDRPVCTVCAPRAASHPSLRPSRPCVTGCGSLGVLPFCGRTPAEPVPRVFALCATHSQALALLPQRAVYPVAAVLRAAQDGAAARSGRPRRVYIR